MKLAKESACIGADVAVQQDSCQARWGKDLRANGLRPPQSTQALFSRTESAGSLPALSASQRGQISAPPYKPFPFFFETQAPASLSYRIKEELEIKYTLKEKKY